MAFKDWVLVDVVKIDGLGVLAEDVVGHIADPQFHTFGVVPSCHRPGEGIRGPLIVVHHPVELGKEPAGRIVIRHGDPDLAVSAGQHVRRFQEQIAPGDHLVFGQRVVRNVREPAPLGPLADLVESNRFRHAVMGLNPRKCYTNFVSMREFDTLTESGGMDCQSACRNGS